MLNISLSKKDFEKIISYSRNTLYKEATKFWSNKFLEPKVVGETLCYELKKFDKLSLSNGLGEDKPSIIIECNNIEYLKEEKKFKITFGKILQQRNTEVGSYKDSLIERLIKEKRELEDKISKDHLTGVFNRLKMEEDLDNLMHSQTAKFLCAVFIDADRFKGINDTFGHTTGDEALKYIAYKIQKHMFTLNGEVYRYGGEEFVILAQQEKRALLENLEVLREDIKSETIYHPEKEISLTVSMGVAFWEEADNKFDFLNLADERVYRAKELGRDKIVAQ